MTRYSEFDEMTASAEYGAGDLPVEVPVAWLMQNATESVDLFDLSTFSGWQHMFSEKCADTGFGHLVESIMARGFLPEGAIGFRDGEITEGHHRLCAAILLCLDTVWITAGGRDILSSNRGYYPLVSAHSNWDNPYSISVAM